VEAFAKLVKFDVSLCVSELSAFAGTGVATVAALNAYTVSGCTGTAGGSEGVKIQFTPFDAVSEDAPLRGLAGMVTFGACEFPTGPGVSPAVSMDDSRTCAKPGIRLLVRSVCVGIAISVFTIAEA
jgi:hypothetical protein